MCVLPYAPRINLISSAAAEYLSRRSHVSNRENDAAISSLNAQLTPFVYVYTRELDAAAALFPCVLLVICITLTGPGLDPFFIHFYQGHCVCAGSQKGRMQPSARDNDIDDDDGNADFEVIVVAVELGAVRGSTGEGEADRERGSLMETYIAGTRRASMSD